MDQPNAPPLSATAQPTSTTALQSYQDSLNSSQHSRATDYDDSHQPPPKLRLMCSYNGHIIPRLHDKTLCYVGGDTRMVVVDRMSTLSDLLTRLTKTLLNYKGTFTLKYQLPNEDLDSLITISNDEDLDNMIEEYDRLSKLPKPGRIRLFLFPAKPDGVHSMGPILDGSNRSEDWFLNALNGAAELHRGFSDPNLNSLIGMDQDIEIVNRESNLKEEVLEKKVGNQDVQSVPDSPIIDTTSSFGSASSIPSFANLAPIRVHVEQRVVGIEEQFAQMGVGIGGGQVQKQQQVTAQQQILGPKQQLGGDLPSPDSISR